jgi:hypothetical protein
MRITSSRDSQMNSEGIGDKPAMASNFHAYADNPEVPVTNPDF